MILGAVKYVWSKWKVLAHKIGDFQARVMLSLFYFVLLGPFALAFRLFSDPLQLRPGNHGGWLDLPEGKDDVSVRARRQF